MLGRLASRRTLTIKRAQKSAVGQQRYVSIELEAKLQKVKTLERMAQALGVTTPARKSEKKPRVKVPLSIPTSSGKRATALFQDYFSRGGIKAAEYFLKELEVFAWSVDGKKSWSALLNTPDQLLPRKTKHYCLAKHMFFLGMSPRFIKTMMPLFHSKDIFRLNQIVSDYADILRAWKREVDVRLITKSALDAQSAEFLKNTVSLNFLEPEDVIIFSTEVDPTILDGYRVVIKGVVHDFTTNKAVEAAKAAQAIRSLPPAKPAQAGPIFASAEEYARKIFGKGEELNQARE